MFGYSMNLWDGAQTEEARALGRHQVVRLSVPISHASKSELSP